MDLQEKDAYIAEHLMKMEKDTLRFMVADLVAEFRRLSETLELAEENGGLIVAERNRLTTANADLQQRLDAVEEALKVAQGAVEALQWTKGEPPKPYCNEWFIALTTYGDRVVLKALPDEFGYDYKTADDTYIKRDKIRAWMQFPDSNYVSFALTAANARVERLEQELETERIRLAGCGVAAMCDTEQSIKEQGIDSDSPYYSASYGDVCRMVRRLMRYRGALEKLARLGNEPYFGNSDGNTIAQKALAGADAKEVKGGV